MVKNNGIKIFKLSCISSSLLFLLSCSSTPTTDIQSELVSPTQWQSVLTKYQDTSPLLSDNIQSDKLKALINDALVNNLELRSQALNLQKAEINLKRAGMALWPDLDFKVDASRGNRNGISNSFSLGLTTSYNLDIWGKLSDAEKAAQLGYQKAEIAFLQTKNNIVSQVANAWFDLVAAENFYKLYEQRTLNVKNNLDIIEQGYQAGLNKALDVYLTRSDYEKEQSRLISQQQQIENASRKLSLLIGGYPDKSITSDFLFKQVKVSVPKGVPAEVIKARPDIQLSWLDVLIDDAELAIAHKNRFPKFEIRASISDEESKVSNLLKDGLWSLAAGITLPILDSRNLKSAEETAQLEFQQSELAYLKTTYEAFHEVETTLTQIDVLDRQKKHAVSQKENAVIAEKLAFEQYLNGLVTYATVLTAQNRTLDAEIQLLELNKNLVVNQISLHLALGKNWQSIAGTEINE
ncbi:TolC family protein [Catenovulum maritimum]|uniref:RND transporter n=1 Tax=Catenovulum maritimum TaxID=1513271 RepID=A0A0J8H027_9ALTE|nr:TolC family protein [Catenovulum maritimum]KMT66358.1 hypothetical protein XM47_03755 [Catenovulum maritimum]